MIFVQRQIIVGFYISMMDVDYYNNLPIAVLVFDQGWSQVWMRLGQRQINVGFYLSMMDVESYNNLPIAVLVL